MTPMIVFDFVHGQVVNLATDRAAAERLERELSQQGPELAGRVGGMPPEPNGDATA